MLPLAVPFSQLASGDRPSGQVPPQLAPPVEDGPFLRPAPGGAAEPVWGIRDGIGVGLWPTPGPRGLLRVFAPYLGHPPHRVINYIAIEPIVDGGRRGLSELEASQRDGVPGKATWSSDEASEGGSGTKPRDPWDHPARGTIKEGEQGASLSMTLHVEPFANGARPVVEVTLREDRPHEVGFRVFDAPGGAEMDTCVLSATMGNYGRVRELSLADRVVTAGELWVGEEPQEGFAPHRRWEVSELLVRDGDAIVAVTPDEPDPAAADHTGIKSFWHYIGRPATQYWRAPAEDDLTVQVNARTTYWGSAAPIPGGISFENFELFAPFYPGRSCCFGVIAGGPEQLGLPSGRAASDA